MLQIGSNLRLADNSGAKGLLIIAIPGEGKKKYASLGDIISVVVKGAIPTSGMEDGSRVRAVIVRTAKEVRRKDGSYIRFDDNAAVIINANKEPVGTRVLGPIAREVKDRGYNKVASLAKEVW
ncbi:50S ribosomal protein L14 [candidate division WWE3 bacterium CG_4_9_14_3_um_filter_41_6]|uniref:Large ribosomal subunit protein uL14 n=1 Tax=candidate division WWE3 bacterium CG_4_10_14_0_2_um_filter_41_14 TaxID=1975072 RepID=A0A2M7TF35_UNCKA|nr:MAG: 50S ribosomal protein L14 [candidate division WWE3 bacterium CG_4_10_14_0_2_um_filter_41_14]PJA39228.1 MAG: 50S ribosomal protein L14 [candidate division WWE3 bacterium CG_4_9_14_3_um_filter_41_6]